MTSENWSNSFNICSMLHISSSRHCVHFCFVEQIQMFTKLFVTYLDVGTQYSVTRWARSELEIHKRCAVPTWWELQRKSSSFFVHSISEKIKVDAWIRKKFWAFHVNKGAHFQKCWLQIEGIATWLKHLNQCFCILYVSVLWVPLYSVYNFQLNSQSI